MFNVPSWKNNYFQQVSQFIQVETGKCMLMYNVTGWKITIFPQGFQLSIHNGNKQMFVNV